MDKKLKAAFFIWISLWIFFLAREIFINGRLGDYKKLLFMGLEEKRSYITGTRLYEFITFCNDKLPKGASYKVIGLDDGSLDKRRLTYYLYPLIEQKDASYTLVFDKADVGAGDFSLFSKLDETRYILKEKDSK